MISPLFVSILATGFAVAFLHGALPNHWLPFVLVSRRQGWSKGKTLAITALAGLGHAAVTMLLGLLLVALGLAVGDRLGPALPLVAGGLLILFGLYYLANHARGGHLHLPFLGRLAPAHGFADEDVSGTALSTGPPSSVCSRSWRSRPAKPSYRFICPACASGGWVSAFSASSSPVQPWRAWSA